MFLLCRASQVASKMMASSTMVHRLSNPQTGDVQQIRGLAASILFQQGWCSGMGPHAGGRC